MDAYGNLTTQAEFSGGRHIRLISYLGQDCAIGATGTIEPGVMGIPMLVSPQVGLHHLSAGDPQRTVFIANACPGGFTLSRAADPRQQLAWGGERQSLTLANAEVSGIAVQPVFIVEFVDGVWFNLRTQDGSLVVDCAGGDTNEGQPLLAWEGNGGDNQKWRAEMVAPLLGAEHAPAGAPAASPPPPPAPAPSALDRVKVFFRRLFGG